MSVYLIANSLSPHSFSATITAFAFSLLAPCLVWAYIWFILGKNDKKPLWTIATCFVWGASIAAGVSLILTSTYGGILSDMFDIPRLVISASIVAPVIEEFSKCCILAFIFFLYPKVYKNVLDGIIYSFMVSIGFAMTENVFYLSKSFDESFLSGLYLAGSRCLIYAFSHSSFTVAFGVALPMSKRGKQGISKLSIILVGFILSVFLHSLWNSSLAMGENVFRIMLITIHVPIVYFCLKKAEKSVNAEKLKQGDST